MWKQWPQRLNNIQRVICIPGNDADRANRLIDVLRLKENAEAANIVDLGVAEGTLAGLGNFSNGMR